MAEEVDYEKILDNLELELHKNEKNWNKIIDDLSKKINNELKHTIELSAEAISYRQMLLEERTQVYYKIYKSMPKLKQLEKSKFEFYSTKYQIKINATEKAKLIDADLSYHSAKMEYLQNHINFLTECVKNVDHVIWSVKNKIEFYNISGLD
ncbi:hypothetical protein M0Q50_00940 [bacterium]|jgi:hypothetical protein|nr:hypothetical protein [bacterium]